MRKSFFVSLTLITLLGLLLRLINYDLVPAWNESLDEIHYAWTGLTWIKTGIPKSWSWLESYKTSETRRIWDTDFRLVSPMFEKPPLYSLLSGGLVLLFNQNTLEEVRIATIRLLPLALSVFTIFLTGIVGQRIFSAPIGLLAALLYTTTPIVVMANRLSVTENLLTPLTLLAQLYFLKVTGINDKRPHVVYISIFSGLSLLTKQIGVTVAIASLALFTLQRKWKSLIITGLITGALFLVYPLIGLMYDWQLFKAIQTEQRRIGLQGGLPQLIQTIVSRPLITTERLFPDGTLLLGYFLLFTSPWWLTVSSWSKRRDVPDDTSRSAAIGFLGDSIEGRFAYLSRKTTSGQKDINDWPLLVFLAFPFTYLAYLVLSITGAEPIGSGQAYWGWYAYPLFPYTIILVAFILHNLWRQFSLLQGFIITLIIGSSAVRYAFLFLPREYHYRWQHALVVLIALVVSVWLITSKKYKKIVLFGIFGLYIGVNVYASIHLNRLYPTLVQP